MNDKLKLGLRLILGLIYFVFGLNFFLHFIPMPPPAQPAMDFVMALINTGYLMYVVKVLEIVFGLALILNFFTPLALLVLAPITLNIFLVHLVLDRSGLVMGLAMLVIHVALGVLNIEKFRSVLNK